VENYCVVGITGSKGFIGKHLSVHLSLLSDQYRVISIDRSAFENVFELDELVSKCHIIIHLAAVNRAENIDFLYNENINLAEKLASSLERCASKARVIFASSIQEKTDSIYGLSKAKSNKILLESALERRGTFTSLIIPNVFGPFSKPNYNTFVATFSHKLLSNIETNIIENSKVDLIYIDNLIRLIIDNFEDSDEYERSIKPDITITVKEVLKKLKVFKNLYFEKGQIPKMKDTFEVNLFNTFRSFIDVKTFFPFQLTNNMDFRGSFIEIVKLGVGGQVSYSTTKPGVTRGNHFHTRKIERFCVIQGQAKIKLRKIDKSESLQFYLNGKSPSFVDMPIWYTHNITNVGDNELITIFWINEIFDPNDSDTYMLEV
jgi:UDP-2-acetamido-2,6-beta-L-arabino-hexul-4-ose reductase